MLGDTLRAGTQHEIHRLRHRGEIEVVVRCPFCGVPPFGVAGWFGVDKVQLRKMIRVLSRPVERSRQKPVEVLGLYPEKPRAVTTQQPFVAGAHHKVGAQILDAHWHRAAGLTDVQQKQSSLCLACGTYPRCVQQSPVVIAHQAHRDDSGSRRQRIDQVIRRDKPIVRRNGPQPYAFTFFHGLPC